MKGGALKGVLDREMGWEVVARVEMEREWRELQ